jgi:hypothetical protein
LKKLQKSSPRNVISQKLWKTLIKIENFIFLFSVLLITFCSFSMVLNSASNSVLSLIGALKLNALKWLKERKNSLFHQVDKTTASSCTRVSVICFVSTQESKILVFFLSQIFKIVHTKVFSFLRNVMLCDMAPLFCLVRNFLKQKFVHSFVKNLSLKVLSSEN